MWAIFTSKYVFIAVVVVVGLIALVILLRGCGCTPHKKKEVDYGPYPVIEVESGDHLTVALGRRERRQREVELEGIDAPVKGEPLFQESLDSLKKLAGSEVTIHQHKEHLVRKPGSFHGIVSGAAGELQTLQLKAGLAKCEAGVTDKDWLAAEAEAKKAKRGLWAKRKAREDWKEVPCDECRGTGSVEGMKCDVCDGIGKLPAKCPLCLNEEPARSTCSVCNKTGQIKRDCILCLGTGKRIGKCPMCEGTGKLYEEQPGVLRNHPPPEEE